MSLREQPPMGDQQPLVLPTDTEFDSVYPESVRRLSTFHWTPVAVAARAASMLTEAGSTRILDVGSGAGKFCILGAMVTDAQFVGVERRRNLVEVSETAAARLGVTRATFLHSSFDRIGFEAFDGIYLYNPFFEHITRAFPQIDDSIEFSTATYRYFTQVVCRRSRRAPRSFRITGSEA